MEKDVQGSRPVPDPTLLTTQQLLREIAALKAVIEAKLEGVDRVLELLQKGLDQRQEKIDARVNHLQVLHEEKFNSIQKQFVERDTRTEQTQKDSKVAVDAALQAAKEAVGEQNKSSANAIAKSEAATTKQMDLLGAQMATNTGNLNDKIEDIKGRLNIIDGRTSGSKESGDSSRASVAMAVSVIAALVGVGAFAFSLVPRGNGNSSAVTPVAPVVVPAQGIVPGAGITPAAPQIIVVPMPAKEAK